MKLSNHEMLHILKSGSTGVHKVLDYLYIKSRSKIINYVAKNGGNKEDGKDVLQEAVAAFYTNIRNNKFRGDSDIEGYLFGIARNIWLRMVNMRSKMKTYSSVENLNDVPIENTYDEEEIISLDSIMKKLDEVCRNLLVHAFYYNYSADELRLHFNFKNEQVARNKKYKCLNKLRKMMVKSKTL